MKYSQNTRLYEAEVRMALEASGKAYPKARPGYFNTDLYLIADIPIAIQRLIYKSGFSFTSSNNTEDLWGIWDEIWKYSSTFEVLNQCLFFVEERKKKKELGSSEWKIIKDWTLKLDNWAHSDSLSSFYAGLHEENHRLIFPVFQVWNRHDNPWLRRQSLVSLYYYSSQRKKPLSFSKALPLVRNLVRDDHFYVQKAVGWTLREMYNLYPEKTFDFLCKNAAILPAASWQASTEKLSPARKEQLKKIRNP